MKDHTFYLVCAYGALLVAVACEIWAIRSRRARAIGYARDLADDADDDAKAAP